VKGADCAYHSHPIWRLRILLLINTLYINGLSITLLLSVKDVILTLGLSDKGVPTSREASEWSVLNALIFAWAQTELDFDIAHQVPGTCGSLLQKGLECISNSLGG
jgi:hypothetical protein